jgi:hypothetical protein
MLGENIAKLRDKMDELNEAKKGVRDIKHVKKAKGTKPDFLDMDKDGNTTEPMKKAVKDKKVKEGAKPDFLDMDKDGDKKEPMKKAVKDKKSDKSVEEGWDDMMKSVNDKAASKGTGKFDSKKTSTGTVYTKKHTKADAEHSPEKKVKEASTKFDPLKHVKNPTPGEKKAAKDVKRSSYADRAAMLRSAEADGRLKSESKLKESNANFKHNVRFVNESLAFLINEDEEGKAKAITAASDMVNDFTSWMQRVGQYQTKAIIELADAIKADFGSEEAETFKQAVAPALAATLETLTAQRETISNAVAVLAGEAAPEEPMGMEPGMDDMGGNMGGEELPPEPGMEPAAPDELNPETDEFGAADAAAGAGTTGREMRESKFALKLAESHSIMAKLAK